MVVVAVEIHITSREEGALQLPVANLPKMATTQISTLATYRILWTMKACCDCLGRLGEWKIPKSSETG